MICFIQFFIITCRRTKLPATGCHANWCLRNWCVLLNVGHQTLSTSFPWSLFRLTKKHCDCSVSACSTILVLIVSNAWVTDPDATVNHTAVNIICRLERCPHAYVMPIHHDLWISALWMLCAPSTHPLKLEHAIETVQIQCYRARGIPCRLQRIPWMRIAGMRAQSCIGVLDLVCITKDQNTNACTVVPQ